MLEINTQEQLMIVRLKADLDMTETVDAFLLMNPQIKTLQIDLSAVSFIDSSGLGAIIGRYKNMLLRQGTLSLVNPAPNVCRILEMSGLKKLVSASVSAKEVL